LLSAGTLLGRVLGERHRSAPAPATTGSHGAVTYPANASKAPECGGHTVASIKPLEDKIVVQASEAETTTASGIVIPDTAKEKPQEGKVLAVGPGRIDDKGNRIPVDVKEGDVVIYSKYGGTEVKYNGEDYLILSARDVLAVVN
jgi:chaperonin GroES